MEQVLPNLIGRQRLQYLRLVALMVQRELKVKYRGTLLGYIWSMLNPLLFMAVIAFVFSHLVRGIPNYEIFILAGIVGWNMVSMALIGGTNSIVGNASLLKKVSVPIWVFPMVPLGTAFVNLLLSLIPYFIIAAFRGVPLSSQFYMLPLILLIFAVFLLGLALALGTLNVFFRDVSHVLEPVLQLIFYGTPIIYNLQHPMIPEKVKTLLLFNPFTHFIECFRATLFGDVVITIERLGIITGLALVSIVAGGLIYKSAKRQIMFSL